MHDLIPRTWIVRLGAVAMILFLLSGSLLVFRSLYSPENLPPDVRLPHRTATR